MPQSSAGLQPRVIVAADRIDGHDLPGYTLEALVEGRAPAQAIVLTKPYRKAELADRLRQALMVTSPVS